MYLINLLALTKVKYTSSILQHTSTYGIKEEKVYILHVYIISTEEVHLKHISEIKPTF